MHSLNLRIYYEDTDAQGVVYYANYLKFFERARTEYLREFGYLQNELLKNKTIFVVNKIDVHYIKPVYLDQIIEVQSKFDFVKNASFSLFQTIVSSNEIKCTAKILCGCIDLESKKPVSLPTEIKTKMKNIL